MSNLRLIGLVVGFVGLLITVRVYRGQRWKKLNFVFYGIFSVSIIIVSLYPDILSTITGMLALKTEHRGRILVLLIFSNIVLWFASLYFKGKLDEYRCQFDLLVRHLGYENAKPRMQTRDLAAEIVAVIPAYNESENLRGLLGKMPSTILGKSLGVIVVDDGSTDDTSETAKASGCLVLENGVRRGGGAALRLGYDVAKYTGAKIAVTMDADGQHDPYQIEKLVEPILQDRSDFVIGSRILGNWEKDKTLRLIGLYFFNFIISLLTRTKITDCSSGFRAFKIDVLDSVILKEDQFHTSELIIDAVKNGVRISEAPITVSRRFHGESKKGRDWKYGLHFARTILKTWWR